MRKVKLYIAISLNGKIAKPDGSVDWLESIPNPQKTDHGYAAFCESIDTTIMGHNTYKQVAGWDIEFTYRDKKNYVLTSNKSLEENEDVTFISTDHVKFIKQLKKLDGKDIWLIGGGNTNSTLMDAKLIDELIVFVMPIILDDGIDFFDSLSEDVTLNFIKSRTYSTGAVELVYETK